LYQFQFNLRFPIKFNYVSIKVKFPKDINDQSALHVEAAKEEENKELLAEADSLGTIDSMVPGFKRKSV
jgi:hypothetical protein